MKVLIVYFHHFAQKFILQRLNISMCHFLNTIRDLNYVWKNGNRRLVLFKIF